MFQNPTNASYTGSVVTFNTRSIPGRTDHDGAESIQSVRKVDPRFMIMEKVEPPPSPINTMTHDVKVESWMNRNEKIQELTKPTTTFAVLDQQKVPPAKSKVIQPARKEFFHNLKELQSVKSGTRNNKLRSLSASRIAISNHDVSSTNEESPRHRKLTLREKLNKLQTPGASSNCQTFDIHYGECSASDSYDCCFKRNCELKTKLDHNVNIVNLCCSNRKFTVPKPKIIPDPILTDEDFEGPEKLPKKLIDKVGNRLDRARLFEEQKHLMRMKREIQNSYMPRGSYEIKPIFKLLIPITIFVIISLALFSMYFDIGVFTRAYNTIETWIGSYALVAIQRSRPPTKWELWSKFFKKCVEKITNIGRKF